MYDCGVRVICIHGRTRGSTKYRRVGPADLVAIGRIAADLQMYHQSHQSHTQIDSMTVWDQQVVVISNGNIISPDDIFRNIKILQDSCQTNETIDSKSPPSPIRGFMSAEGILKDPALFYRFQLLQDSVTSTTVSTPPTLSELFAEYCKISSLYSSLNGWEGLNLLDAQKCSQVISFSHTSASSDVSHSLLPKSVSVARQHLNWMLGKSGHGRLIRYEYLAEVYKRHTDQMNEINRCTNVEELLQIAESAFLTPSLEF